MEKYVKSIFLLILFGLYCRDLYAQNPHDLEFGKSVSSREVGGSNVVRARSGNKKNVVIDGEYEPSLDGKSHFGTLKVTSDNTINTTIDAHDGGKVLIGDVELSNVKSDSLEIETRNTVNSQVRAVGKGAEYEVGTVRLGGYQGRKTEITTTNTINGQVGSNGSVVMGRVRIGNTEDPRHRNAGVGKGKDAKGTRVKHQNCNELVSKFATDITKLRQWEEDLKYAQASKCAYSDDACDSVPEGWTKLGKAKKLPLSIEYVRFINEDGKTVIAFRGSKGRVDWLANLTPEFRELTIKRVISPIAQDFVRSQGKENVIFTGHSKGGGEAIWAAAITGATAITFNHRPSPLTMPRKWITKPELRCYGVKGEILSNIRIDKECTRLPRPPVFDHRVNGIREIIDESIELHDIRNVISGLQRLIREKKMEIFGKAGMVCDI